jgi:hypothetical protein
MHDDEATSEAQKPNGSAAPRHWLYSMGEGSGAAFLRGNDRLDRYSEYRTAIVAGALRTGEGPLDSGFLSIRAGDVFWLYGGDHLGIVGRGTVKEIRGRPDARVTFTVDRAESRVLVLDPIPAGPVRRRVRVTRSGALPLSDHPAASQGFQWWLDRLGERDQHQLERFDVTPLRDVIARRPSRLHDDALVGLIRALRIQGLGIGLTPARVAADVVAANDDSLVVGLALASDRSGVPRQLLDVLGELEWFGWSLTEGYARAVHLWVGYPSEPRPDVVNFLEQQGHSVSWLRGSHIEMSAATAKRWQTGAHDPRGELHVRPMSVPQVPRSSVPSAGRHLEGTPREAMAPPLPSSR